LEEWVGRGGETWNQGTKTARVAGK